jgi:hypothetical protein
LAFVIDISRELPALENERIDVRGGSGSHMAAVLLCLMALSVTRFEAASAKIDRHTIYLCAPKDIDCTSSGPLFLQRPGHLRELASDLFLAEQ